MTATTCPSCSSPDLIYDPERGELVCAHCGLVLSEHIVDQGPEWRAFTAEDKINRSRVGGRITNKVHDHGLTTVIDVSDARKLSGRMRARMIRIARMQRKLRVKPSDRKLVGILADVNNYTARLGLPDDVRETACSIMKRVVKVANIKGRMVYGYMAAAIYIACKLHRIPKTLNEIACMLGVSRREAWYAFRKIRSTVLSSTKMPVAKPVDYVPRIASELKLPASVQTKAAEILRYLMKLGVAEGKGPIGLAAAAVYVASVVLDAKRTQKEVAEKAGITEVTVRNRYKDIVDRVTIEVLL